MVPGSAFVGSVAPARERKPAMHCWPSMTIAVTGPEDMKSTSSPKNGFAACSA